MLGPLLAIASGITSDGGIRYCSDCVSLTTQSPQCLVRFNRLTALSGGDLCNIVLMRPGQAVCRPVLVFAIGVSFLLSGCGGTSQAELDKAKAAGASEEAARQSATAQQDAQAKLAAEVQKLKEQLAAKTATSTPSTVTAPAPAAPQGASCGGNVSAGANTTCPFALNVAAEYLTQGGGTRSLVVYSPVTGLDYTMNCVAGVPSVCRGGNNAVVYIR